MPPGTDLKQEVAGLYSYADPLHRLMSSQMAYNVYQVRVYRIVLPCITIKNSIIFQLRGRPELSIFVFVC